MLTIVCGEDQISSRNYYQKLRSGHISRGHEVVDISKQNFDQLSRVILEKPSLFANQQAFFSEHLVKHIKKHKSKSLLEEIDRLISDKTITWIDWESYSGREITNPKKANIQDFKLPLSIFNFLESIYPSNLENVSLQLKKLSETLDEGFIFTMTCRHIRQMIICTTQNGINVIPPWQYRKLKEQAVLWDTQKLVSFYSGLARLDSSIKTSSNAFGILKSLEVLLLYFI